MAEDDRFLYSRDETGRRRDDAIHEPFLADPDSELWFQLTVIRDYVAEGHSLDDAVALFGTGPIRQAHARGLLPEVLDSLS
jgi:hypothetical protein